MSRTVAHGRRFIAPPAVADHQISKIAERNFRATARYLVDHFESLELDLPCAILLNRMLTEGLVPETSRGDPFFRAYTRFAGQTDSFVRGDPKRFYEWLRTPAARDLAGKDPVALAEIIHNNLVALDSFPDGNGRLSRLFSDLALLKAGLAPAAYTSMADYFERGNARAPVSRAERQRYYREIVSAGQARVWGPDAAPRRRARRPASSARRAVCAERAA